MAAENTTCTGDRKTHWWCVNYAEEDTGRLKTHLTQPYMSIFKGVVYRGVKCSTDKKTKLRQNQLIRHLHLPPLHLPPLFLSSSSPDSSLSSLISSPWLAVRQAVSALPPPSAQQSSFPKAACHLRPPWESNPQLLCSITDGQAAMLF